MEEGKIVAEYRLESCTVRVSDAAFAHKTPEQLARDREYARQTACRILMRAAQRGGMDSSTRRACEAMTGTDCRASERTGSQ